MAVNSETIRELALIAIEIAAEAPLRKNKYAVSAYIPWRTVEKLRAELDKAGIDWRKVAEAGR